MKCDTLTIVGVGLIGASIGLAAKRRHCARHVIGIGRNRDSLERARELGAIDAYALEMADGVRDADFIVFCTPVDRIAEQVLQAAPHCRPGVVITDAGSTKGRLVADIDGRLPEGVHFVGSHPLAGSEKRGPEHGSADLFQNRWTVITPTSLTNGDALVRTFEFWQALGSRPRFLDPDEHDRVLALTSHLPHLAAAALAALLPAKFFDFAATGFRDTTRIAAGDPELWTAIFEHNSVALLHTLEQFEERLAAFRKAIAAGDHAVIDQLLRDGKVVRDGLK